MSKTIIISLIFGLIALSALPLAAAQEGSNLLKINLLNQDPDPVKQGDVVEVRFKIENIGKETLNNVIVRLLPDYPFSIYTGPSEKEFGKLRASQTGADAVIADFKLKVDKEAVEGDNEIELEVIIEGKVTQRFTKNEFEIDVEDYEFPEIKAYIRETDIISAGQKGSLVIELANTDIEDVKFLQMTLLPSEEYDLLSSSNYVYIGDIDSDDTESERFSIYVKPGAKNTLLIPIHVEYEDTNELEYREDFVLKLKIYDKNEAKTLGLKETNSRLAIGAVILAIILFVYFYWRRRRK